MTTNFDNLNINENILKGVYLYGFKEPSPIQKNLRTDGYVDIIKDIISTPEEFYDAKEWLIESFTS